MVWPPDPNSRDIYMADDRGSNAVPLAIIGLMTASRRLRATGGILGLVFLAAAPIVWLFTAGQKDGWIFPALVGVFGLIFVFYWLVASVLAWAFRD